MHELRLLNRRQFLGETARSALALAVAAKMAHARARPPLEVAYAGSMGAVMESSIKPAVAAELGLNWHGYAQGSTALAQLIAGDSLRPDVFIAVTASPIQTVLRAAKAAAAVAVARTAMAIAYAPQSRFGGQFARAGRAGAMPWWQVLEQPGLRFGRSDPAIDPQGRNIIFVLQLAEHFYHQPELSHRVLGDITNPAQIFAEASLEVRLQSGQIDAAPAYKFQPGPFHTGLVVLPPELDLSRALGPGEADVALTVAGRIWHPEPLVFYAAALRDAPHPVAAQTFLAWLAGDRAQRILRHAGYDPPGDAAALTAQGNE